MPIRPENRGLYPRNWKEIRKAILQRANDRCEGCGVVNHAVGTRDSKGRFDEMGPMEAEVAGMVDGERVVVIVLTIAHLDHDPTNNDPENLRAWCQKCHNSYDAPHRAAGRKERRASAAAQMSLFDCERVQA